MTIKKCDICGKEMKKWVSIRTTIETSDDIDPVSEFADLLFVKPIEGPSIPLSGSCVEYCLPCFLEKSKTVNKMFEEFKDD